MKRVKYILVSLALALFIAGCAGSSGASNLDTTMEKIYTHSEEDNM